jgi:hypothetical protein
MWFFGDFRLDSGFGPERIEEFIVRHQAADVFHQISQYRKRLGRQDDRFSAIYSSPHTLLTPSNSKWLGTLSRCPTLDWFPFAALVRDAGISRSFSCGRAQFDTEPLRFLNPNVTTNTR